MQLGIHLPQAGSKASPELIRNHARRAEDIGLSDVWVSEHIIVPRKQFPRSPLFYDPILTLTWVAAVTERVRLGTSVIVLPMRHPLPLAKELATLHNLSGGRLILGVGVGWLEAEFAALGVPFHGGGRRDEGARRGLCRGRGAAHHGPPTGPRGRRLGHRHRGRRQTRGGVGVRGTGRHDGLAGVASRRSSKRLSISQSAEGRNHHGE